MAINAIVSADGRTQGWQVRVYVASGHPYLTKFYAWRKWGGKRGSFDRAAATHEVLARRAVRLRRQIKRNAT